MPQYGSYPVITSLQPDDLVLVHQDSSASEKLISVDNLADSIGDIIVSTIGAPLTAQYILRIPNGNLSSAQSLSELATGILKSTTGTGDLSIAVAGTDYMSPGIITSSGLTSITGVVLGRTTAGTGAIEALTVLPDAVQDNITRVGTVASGTWNGSAIDLSAYVTGNLSVNNLDGGTNASATTFWAGNGTWLNGGWVINTGALTVNQVVVGNSGSGAKILAATTNGFVLTLVAGIPAWAAIPSAGSPGGVNTHLQYNDSGVFGGISGATTDGTTVTLLSPKIVTSLLDTNGNELFKFTATGSAVNELTIANAATGSGPTISATGGDTDISINLTPKGAGLVSISGDVITNAVGKTFAVKSGSNAKAGTFTLASGLVTVSNTSVTANSVIVATVKTSSGTLGLFSPEIVINAGTGFSATGAVTDNSTYNFVIVEVN